MNGDVIAFYAELGITLRPGGREAPARCFANPEAHQRGDRTPSTSVSLVSGAWFCHGCGAKGGAYDAARVRGCSPADAVALLTRHGLANPRPATSHVRRSREQGRPHSRKSPTFGVTEDDVLRWAEVLQREAAVLARLEELRGITSSTIGRFRVGWSRGRITIPIRDEVGELRGLVCHRPWPGRGPKTIAEAGSQRLLFPHPCQVRGSRVILCEGEIDALTAHSCGIPAVAIPGANGWRAGWVSPLVDRQVIVVPDADPAGRACAVVVAADLTAAGGRVAVLDPDPSREDGYDLGALLLDRRTLTEAAEQMRPTE